MCHRDPAFLPSITDGCEPECKIVLAFLQSLGCRDGHALATAPALEQLARPQAQKKHNCFWPGLLKNMILKPNFRKKQKLLWWNTSFMPHHRKIGPSTHATSTAPLPGNSLSWHSLSSLIPAKSPKIFGGRIRSCPIMETLSPPFMPLTLQPSRKFPQLALTLFHVISKKCEKLFWRKTVWRGLARQARPLQGLEAWELAVAFKAGQGLEAWGLPLGGRGGQEINSK